MTPTTDTDRSRSCWQCDGCGYVAPASRIKPKGGLPSLNKCGICDGTGRLGDIDQALATARDVMTHLTSPPLRPGGERITVRALGVDVPVYVRALTPAGVPWYEAVEIDHVYSDDLALIIGQLAIARAVRRAGQKRKETESDGGLNVESQTSAPVGMPLKRCRTCDGDGYVSEPGWSPGDPGFYDECPDCHGSGYAE
jgi:hypothetical protein